MRPEVSEDVREEVEALTTDTFAVPEERVTFDDRLRVLTERIRDQQETIRELREKRQQQRQPPQDVPEDAVVDDQRLGGGGFNRS